MQKIYFIFLNLFTMNNLTLFIAQIAGPIFLATGLGLLFNNAHYSTLYKKLKEETMAVFGFALFTMAIGIVIILKHNQWTTTPEIIVSLLGWGGLFKGVSLLIMPTFIENFTNNLPLSKMLPIAGIFAALLGGYLTWFAYFV